MKRAFGFHYLADLGLLQESEGRQLFTAAKNAAKLGCTLFELACPPVLEMSPAYIARNMLIAGIEEVSYCRFFPGDGSFGDPVGDEDEERLALQTICSDLETMLFLRNHGLNVHYMTGPSCFVLGREYSNHADIRDRMVKYLRTVGYFAFEKQVTVCIEYLRPGEDCGAIGSMEAACALIDRVNHPNIKLHADIFHMLERHEDPAQAIRIAGPRLAYLHAHGSKCLEPGAHRKDGDIAVVDSVDWGAVALALDEIGYTGPIVPEPFGQAIRDAVPELGEGLPPAISAEQYYKQARKKFEEVGIL